MNEVNEEINYFKTNGTVPKGWTALSVIAIGITGIIASFLPQMAEIKIP